MGRGAMDAIKENIKEYYGQTLSATADLKTDACCTADAVPASIAKLLARIHPEICNRYYGCGLIAPSCLEGAQILDLGAGAGRDAYLLAQLAGPEGRVVGVDMTLEQLAVARAHLGWHARKFGYANVSFINGDIENLAQTGLAPAQFDVIVSNCVINLAPNKSAVFAGVFDLLKPGGEFYFADVYADRPPPEAFRDDPIAQGECLGGAISVEQFFKIARDAGFAAPRLVTRRPIAIDNAQLREKAGATKFFAATYRLFRLDNAAAILDAPTAVSYRGGIEGSENAFILDGDHCFVKNTWTRVDAISYQLLTQSRFASFFDVAAGEAAASNSAKAASAQTKSKSGCC